MSLGPIASLPISALPSAAAPIVLPSVGPSYTFSPQEVKIRYGEKYLSEASNRKFLGIPRGVYLGFTPNFNGNVLTLAIDPTYGVSFARLTSSIDPLSSVDVISTEPVMLDFTGHVVFPVNVVLKANAALGQPHQALIVVQVAPPIDPTEILVCRVSAIGAVSAGLPADRANPYAYVGAPLGFGFMKSGAVEELLAAIDVVAEVQAARTDLTGFTHPNLGARLAADAAGTAMANRLGKEIKNLQGSDLPIIVPVSSVNVSRAFSGLHRGLLGLSPAENIGPFGSETRVAAVTSGALPVVPPAGALIDPFRNVCEVVDSSTKARVLNTNRQIAYGRLVAGEVVLSGAVNFSIGVPGVVGIGTSFLSQIVTGDIIQDPNGNFYEVLLVINNSSLTLSVNALATVGGPGLLRRRFTLEMRTRTGPVDSVDEAPFLLPGGSTVRFFFPMWRTLATAQFDVLPLFSQNFVDTPVTPATTVAPGLAAVVATAPDGKAGAIYEIRHNDPVNGPHVHTIDFHGVSAGVGVANVTQRGPTGVQGPAGTLGPPGPAGPAGPAGPGLTTEVLLNTSGTFDHFALGAGVAYSHSHVFAGPIKFLTGGNVYWYGPTNFGFFDFDDHWEITLIDIAVNTGTIYAKVPSVGTPSVQVKFALNGAV